MKKLIYSLSAFLMLFLSAETSFAATVSDDKAPASQVTTLTEEEKAAKIQAIEKRVLEIKAMNKSNLTSAERKALRKELKEMKQQARAFTSGGVYLSVGAIIIIILVLILIV
jgi:hypothetical protein